MAICAGCGVDSSKFTVYNRDNPVEADGTYAFGKFVCDECYLRLVNNGMGLGDPETLQWRASILPKVKNESKNPD